MAGYRLKNTIADSKTQVLYIYGEKEMGCVKESAKLFKKMHPDCTLYEAKGYNHGYLSAYLGSMSNNVGDNLNQQNLLNYAAASIAN